MNKTYHFSLPDIACINCVEPINTKLLKSKDLQIKHFNVSIIDKTLTITLLNNESDTILKNKIINLLDDIGVLCVEQSLGDTGAQNAEAQKKQGFFKRYRHWFLAALGIVPGVLLLISTIFFPLPALMALPVAIGAITLTLALGGEFFYQAFKKLFITRTMTMDLLFSLSTITTVGVTIGSFFVPWLKPLLDTGLLIFGFRHLGLAIDELIKKSMHLEKKIVDRLPKKILVETQDGVELREVQALEIGDVIIVNPDEFVPVDGIALNTTQITEGILSGSAWPVLIEKNADILSGIKVAPGVAPLKLKVTAGIVDSYAAKYDAQIANLVQTTPREKTIAEKILKYFIPIVIAVAIISAVIIGVFFPLSLAVQSLITVLVSACPCTLGLVIPLAQTIGFSKAKNHGICFKDNARVEKAANPNWIFFDFNGTVTEGILTVMDLKIYDEIFTHTDFLTILKLLEKDSKHLVARALSNYVEENLKQAINEDSFVVQNVDTTHHSGVRAEINGQIYTIGNQEMMQSYGIQIPDWQGRKLEAGDGVTYLARGKNVLGHIVISDPVRPQVKKVIAYLKNTKEYKNGTLNIGGITGADHQTAQRIAQEIGIDIEHVYAEYRGGDDKENAKAKLLREIKGRTVFIGDGSNDEAAFKAASFSVAMQSPNNNNNDTQEHADAVISHINALPGLLEISKQTVRNIKQSLIFSFSYNVLAMTLLGSVLIAVGFAINPAIGVVLMTLQSILVLCNALRFKEQPIDYFESRHDKNVVISNEHQQQVNDNVNDVSSTYNPILKLLQENQSQNEIAESKLSERDFVDENIGEHVYLSSSSTSEDAIYSQNTEESYISNKSCDSENSISSEDINDFGVPAPV